MSAKPAKPHFRDLRIIIEHVRSFTDRQSIPLRPLTVLVGENSSGKTTFLAAVSAILDPVRFPLSPGFNESPYNLGTFDTIATFKGGRYGRAREFSIGFDWGNGSRPQPRKVEATFRSDVGNVVLAGISGVSSLGSFRLSISNSAAKLRLQSANQPPIEIPFELAERALLRSAGLMQWLFQTLGSRLAHDHGERSVGHVYRLIESASPPFGPCHSFAPIRSKPRRTYDELSEDYSPEGDHVPSLLARLLDQESDSTESRQVMDALRQFGKESGLFAELDVKRLGKLPTDPFQLQVNIAGPRVNLIDVGYGVSQALPIVVESALEKFHSK